MTMEECTSRLLLMSVDDDDDDDDVSLLDHVWSVLRDSVMVRLLLLFFRFHHHHYHSIMWCDQIVEKLTSVSTLSFRRFVVSSRLYGWVG